MIALEPAAGYPAVPSVRWDRRQRPRLPLVYPIILSRPGEAGQVVTKTENVSAEGFYCTVDNPFSPHELVEFELTMSGQDFGHAFGRDLLLRGRAHVIRVVANGDTPGFGIACRIESYKISPKS